MREPVRRRMLDAGAVDHEARVDWRRRHEDRDDAVGRAFFLERLEVLHDGPAVCAGAVVVDAAHDDEDARRERQDIVLEAVDHVLRRIAADAEVLDGHRGIRLPVVERVRWRHAHDAAAMRDAVAERSNRRRRSHRKAVLRRPVAQRCAVRIYGAHAPVVAARRRVGIPVVDVVLTGLQRLEVHVLRALLAVDLHFVVLGARHRDPGVDGVLGRIVHLVVR